MRETDYLDPNALNEQRSSAIRNIKMENDDLDISENCITEFMLDDKISSEAYDTLKDQMEYYKKIIGIMRDANHSDCCDLNDLCEIAGNEVLDGGLIFSRLRSTKQASEEYADKSEYYTRKARKYSEIEVLWTAYKGMARFYSALSDSEMREYDAWNKKATKYDEIEYNTRNLFVATGLLRNKAKEGLMYLGKSFDPQSHSYVLPPELDKWKKEIRELEHGIDENRESSFDKDLSKLITYEDKNGKIKDYNYERILNWILLFKMGKLTSSQILALKTAIMSFPGFIDRTTGSENEVNDKLVLLSKIQKEIGRGWAIFGFEYSEERKAFYTDQNSMQSYFGFCDLFDEAGSGLGMDLDTEKVQFVYNGKEYRFQVWKGIYGNGTLSGGEQGWYVYDPKDKAQYVENKVFDALHQEDWVPAASAKDDTSKGKKHNDRIRMRNIIYDDKANSRLTDTSDTNEYASDGAYWNLCTTAEKSGYTKTSLRCEGSLIINDKGLRNKMVEEMEDVDFFENVSVSGNQIDYTWR
jgi:hypothetical protein